VGHKAKEVKRISVPGCLVNDNGLNLQGLQLLPPSIASAATLAASNKDVFVLISRI